MLFKRLATFFVLLSTVLLVQVSALPTAEPDYPDLAGLTNAERMARGFPLAKPQRRYDPSRTHRYYPRQSANSEPQMFLEVYKFAQADPFGYVAYNEGRLYVDTDSSLAEPFRIPDSGTTTDLTIRTFRTKDQYAAWSVKEPGQVGGGGDGVVQLSISQVSDNGNQLASLAANDFETSVWNVTEVPGSEDFRWYNDVILPSDYETYHPKIYLDVDNGNFLYGAESAEKTLVSGVERVLVRYVTTRVCTNCTPPPPPP